MTRYVRFLRKFVRYLPGLTPEHIVWDEDTAAQLFGDLSQTVIAQEKYKRKLELISNEKPALKADSIFELLLSKLLEDNSDPRKVELLECIQDIRNVANST